MKALALLLLLSTPALAGDPRFWGDYPPEVHEWFPTVMQPGWENRTDQGHSCCAEADAFEARVVGEDGIGNIVVIIDDGKGSVPDGTEVHASRDKIQTRYGNPVGKLVIFVSPGNPQQVYCLVPYGGN